MGTREKLELEVATLGELSRPDLVCLWTKAHRSSPPKGIKRGLLERSAAWHVQAKALGGLSPEARRALKSAIRGVETQIVSSRSSKRMEQQPETSEIGQRTSSDETEANPPAVSRARQHGPRRDSSARPPIVLSPGARLMREWNGRRHFVEVSEDGYVFDGKTYRSLSAIAKRITGAHWSGPRFFGL